MASIFSGAGRADSVACGSDRREVLRLRRRAALTPRETKKGAGTPLRMTIALHAAADDFAGEFARRRAMRYVFAVGDDAAGIFVAAQCCAGCGRFGWRAGDWPREA